MYSLYLDINTGKYIDGAGIPCNYLNVRLCCCRSPHPPPQTSQSTYRLPDSGRFKLDRSHCEIIQLAVWINQCHWWLNHHSLKTMRLITNPYPEMVKTSSQWGAPRPIIQHFFRTINFWGPNFKYPPKKSWENHWILILTWCDRWIESTKHGKTTTH